MKKGAVEVCIYNLNKEKIKNEKRTTKFIIDFRTSLIFKVYKIQSSQKLLVLFDFLAALEIKLHFYVAA